MSAGTCRCGAVRFRIAGAPILTMACHCDGCRRMSASAFSLSSLYPAERFELTEGETVRGGRKSGPNHRFCASCMSWLFTIPEKLTDFVNVRSSTLDDAAAHRPFVDMFLSEGFEWVATGAPRRYDTAPEQADFPAVMAAYSKWDRRVTE